jgi:restriction system protein
MARRNSFVRLIDQTVKESAKSERARQRENERAIRQKLKLEAQASKEAKQRYLESCQEETDDLNKDLAEKMDELQSVLYKALNVNSLISFPSLKNTEEFKKFKLPMDLQKEPIIVSQEEHLSKVPKPTVLEKLIPGWEKRYQSQLQEAQRHYDEYKVKFEAFTNERNIKIAKLRAEYDKEKQSFDLRIQSQNKEIDGFENAYKAGEATAIASYCTMVLEHSDYPESFPQEFRVAYIPEPKELVIEYELPNKSIVPSVAEYRYIKTKDAIDEKSRKSSEIKDIYQDIVSSICLRTIHELIEADQGNYIDVIVFNGFVNDTDPATGKDIRPCLISIRTTKGNFQEINLARVDKKACLRNLGAQVSSRPDELMAVKPIIEFDMVDKRFVEESDILTGLESRPNLMDLTPFEFENLINNLFGRIGFDAKSTQASRDGGVDVVAFDARPILGGKVVIQAKRYKNVVGVSAVRDLYGTMINEGANKGILVTTSHYGKDAYEFAKDKPIELIDGGGLLYLLEQNGTKARIIFPEE